MTDGGEPQDESRGALRRPVALEARLRDRTSTRVGIHVLDLSTTGFRAEADYSLDPGNIVWIALPGLAGLEARVAWRKGRLIGAAFVQPLHPAVFDHIVTLAGKD